MSAESLKLDVVTERPVVRNDQASDIDVAVEVITNKSIETQSVKHAINLCIVIDRSGSMAGDKLEQAKKACVDIHECLGPDDMLTVLAFDDQVVSLATPQTPRSAVKDRIHALTAGNSTDLSKGWHLGLLELQTYATDRHINRIILLSDGEANRGEQKPSILGAESSRARNEFSITTSTIGIGSKFQEDILAALAHESGGRFWYIGEARIEDIIKEEFSGALSVMFERPRIELQLPHGVSIVKELNNLPKIANNYRLRPLKGNDHFSFALRLRVDPTGTDSDKLPIQATMRDGGHVVKRAETTLCLGSMTDHVQSVEDLRVAIAVQKHQTIISGEMIIQEMDTGSLTMMRTMLQSQTDAMRDAERNISNSITFAIENICDPDDPPESYIGRSMQQTAQLQVAIEENEALLAVGDLVTLLQGAGRFDDAVTLKQLVRKVQVQRNNRTEYDAARGDVDDWAVQAVLVRAKEVVRRFLSDFPMLHEDLTSIIRRLDEQLALFS